MYIGALRHSRHHGVTLSARVFVLMCRCLSKKHTQHPVSHPVIAHWCRAIKVNTLWPGVVSLLGDIFQR